mmetsp:Transcript_127257/g.179613  ORF Transcript_127257/g.179613 Transcript_127257/m.179613 type:complete len:84 (+) Transcript_127257:689-940(+)
MLRRPERKEMFSTWYGSRRAASSRKSKGVRIRTCLKITSGKADLPGVSRTLCRRRLRFRSKLQNEAFDLEARSSSIEVIGLTQ